MSNNIKNCRICLRPDRQVKIIDDELFDLHEELCEYAVYTLSPQYCLECECLLRKTYNFRIKCKKALKLFNEWKKQSGKDKAPQEELWKGLPSSLAVWKQTSALTLNYDYNDDLSTSIIFEGQKSHITHINIFANNEIKLENDIEPDLKYSKAEDSTKLLNKEDIEQNIEVIELPQNGIKEENQFDVSMLEKDPQEIDEGTQIIEGSMKNDFNDDFNVLGDLSSDESDDEQISKLVNRKKNIAKKSVKNTKEVKKIMKSIKKSKIQKISKREKAKLESLQFSKERLKYLLELRLSAWGPLKMDDGSVVDKEAILNCIDDKISDDRMMQLWHSIQGEKPEPVTLRTLKHLVRYFTNEELYTSVFDIEYLNTEAKMVEEIQRRKTYECYIQAKYKCDTCFLVFYKPKHLENHAKHHKGSAGSFLCKICNIRCTNGKNFRGHMLAHSAVYRCRLCPLVTYYRESMINHYDQHQGKTYACEICGVVSKSLSGSKRHQYLSHRRGQHVCTVCGRAFVSSLGVMLHRKKMHSNESPPDENTTTVNCPECDLSFPSEEVLHKHTTTWHQAHKKGPDNVKRKRIRSVKAKPPSITCRICGASGSIGWLTLHFRTDHPTHDMNAVYADKRKHLCHICAKGFWNATSLRYHLNHHAGIRPYACDLCPKRCHSSIALNEHRLRHFPPTKECKECGKKFRTPSNLHNHMLFHTGTRRHKCNICGKAFLHSTSMKEHVRGVHYNVRRGKRRAGGGGGDEGEGVPAGGDSE